MPYRLRTVVLTNLYPYHYHLRASSYFLNCTPFLVTLFLLTCPPLLLESIGSLRKEGVVYAFPY